MVILVKPFVQRASQKGHRNAFAGKKKLLKMYALLMLRLFLIIMYFLNLKGNNSENSKSG